MKHRQAGPADVPAVVATITGAFDADPAWTWVFPDADRRAALTPRLWRLLVEGALRYSTVWTTEHAESVSVWLPPGGTELSEEQEPELESLLAAMPTDTARRCATLIEVFEAHRPLDRPHHYLSLFATHPDHRGHGHGMRLLQADLDRIDDAGGAAYLESTNPVNLARYASVGFRVAAAFDLPDGPTVTTMWRDARAV